MIQVVASSPATVGCLTGILSKAGHAVRVDSYTFIATSYLSGRQLVILINSKGVRLEEICNMCSLIRTSAPNLPILVVGPDDTDAKVRLFELGADDYVVKPFDHQEFLARIRSLIRRLQSGFS